MAKEEIPTIYLRMDITKLKQGSDSAEQHLQKVKTAAQETNEELNKIKKSLEWKNTDVTVPKWLTVVSKYAGFASFIPLPRPLSLALMTLGAGSDIYKSSVKLYEGIYNLSHRTLAEQADYWAWMARNAQTAIEANKKALNKPDIDDAERQVRLANTAKLEKNREQYVGYAANMYQTLQGVGIAVPREAAAIIKEAAAIRSKPKPVEATTGAPPASPTPQPQSDKAGRGADAVSANIAYGRKMLDEIEQEKMRGLAQNATGMATAFEDLDLFNRIFAPKEGDEFNLTRDYQAWAEQAGREFAETFQGYVETASDTDLPGKVAFSENLEKDLADLPVYVRQASEEAGDAAFTIPVWLYVRPGPGGASGGGDFDAGFVESPAMLNPAGR